MAPSLRKAVTGIGIALAFTNLVVSTPTHIIAPAETKKPSTTKPSTYKTKKGTALEKRVTSPKPAYLKSLHDDLYDRGENVCLEEDWFLATRIMAEKGDFENAIRLCEENESYICAADIALKTGKLDEAKEYLLMEAEKDDPPECLIANRFDKIGEYSLAMEHYRKGEAINFMIELALENDDGETAKKLYTEYAESTPNLAYESFDLALKFGYAEQFKEDCKKMGSRYCLEEIRYATGTPEEVIQFELEEENYIKALAYAKEKGISIPNIEEKIEEEIQEAIENEMLFSKHEFLIMAGYGEKILQLYRGRKDLDFRERLDFAALLNRHDEAFSIYQELPPYPWALTAARYAREHGLYNKEAEFLQRYLDYKKVDPANINAIDFTESFSIASALARLGYLEETMQVCELTHDCYCALDTLNLLDDYTGL